MAKKETAHKDESVEQASVEEIVVTPRGQVFFFPNTEVGAPKGFEAESREEAEALNQKYLDELKDQQEETN